MHLTPRSHRGSWATQGPLAGGSFSGAENVFPGLLASRMLPPPQRATLCRAPAPQPWHGGAGGHRATGPAWPAGTKAISSQGLLLLKSFAALSRREAFPPGFGAASPVPSECGASPGSTLGIDRGWAPAFPHLRTRVRGTRWHDPIYRKRHGVSPPPSRPKSLTRRGGTGLPRPPPARLGLISPGAATPALPLAPRWRVLPSAASERGF